MSNISGTSPAVVNADCATDSLVESEAIVLQVYPEITPPTVSIYAEPGNIINAGQLVTFSAVVSPGNFIPTFLWKKNGVSVSNNDTYSTYQLQSGDYVSLEFIANTYCNEIEPIQSNLIEMEVISNTNFEEIGLLNIYPNPASDKFLVELPESINPNNHQFILTDITGKQVLIKSYSNLPPKSVLYFELDQNLSSGIYLLNWSNDSYHSHHKIVIQR